MPPPSYGIRYCCGVCVYVRMYKSSTQPKSKKKVENNSPSEPTASKSVTPVLKLDVTYYPPFYVDKKSPSDERNKLQDFFIN